ncbi:hypothetical protein [Actinomadura barringtoniae]|uniref:hypothetical protein n=1 Tax=Actinomadura barringtoniae TaxID=1427535 RepID=UPI001FB5BD44|nr:hypothetical protein [Actinomadura barringtoniae]
MPLPRLHGARRRRHREAVLGAPRRPGSPDARRAPLPALTGTILDASPHLLVLQTAGGERRLPMTQATRVWHGGRGGLAVLRPGRDVIVRPTPDGLGADRVWVEIGRVTGTILACGRDTVEVDMGPHRGQAHVVIPPHALGQILVRHPRLEPGYLIDVICVRSPNGPQAVRPGTSQPGHRADTPPSPDPHAPAADPLQGTCTWFGGAAYTPPPGIQTWAAHLNEAGPSHKLHPGLRTPSHGSAHTAADEHAALTLPDMRPSPPSAYKRPADDGTLTVPDMRAVNPEDMRAAHAEGPGAAHAEGPGAAHAEDLRATHAEDLGVRGGGSVLTVHAREEGSAYAGQAWGSSGGGPARAAEEAAVPGWAGTLADTYDLLGRSSVGVARARRGSVGDAYRLVGASYPAVDPEGEGGGCADAPTGCVALPYLSLGSELIVHNECTGRSGVIPVVECGCVAARYCDRCVECETSPRGRLVELTPAAFVGLGGDLEAGCFNVTLRHQAPGRA